MNNDRPPNGPTRPSLLTRLARMFSREPVDSEQLIELLRSVHQHNLFDADALSMLEGVLQVDDMQVRDIMIPRSQVVILERDASPDALLQTVVESGHSRFPVIGDNRNEVVGILLAKDLLLYAFERTDGRFNVKEILRPAIYVPESKRLNVLLKEFRSSRNHMAIVVDEYGGVSGLVTIEDVLEQIVGDIEDEHDFDETAAILKLNDNEFTVKALTPVDEFNEYFGTAYSDEEFDTIGGVVMNSFGHVPKRNEIVVLGELQFRVMRADKRRVHLLKVVRHPVQADTGA